VDRVLLCRAAVDSFAAGNLVDDYPMDRIVVTNADDKVPVRSSEAGQGRRHLSAKKGGWMREHGQNTDNLRTVGERVPLRTMNKSLKDLEKFGGPPRDRTEDPLIKSQLLYQLS
jgi:hypothetical protein